MQNFDFVGHVTVGAQQLRAGFMSPPLEESMAPTSAGATNGGATKVSTGISPVLRSELDSLARGSFTGDLSGFASQMAREIETLKNDVSRAITSQTSGLPVRENLEAPALVLVPQDTPFRNLLPRTVGSGLASAWRQVVSLGGGWGTGVTQPGGGAAKRVFYAELGAPEEFSTAYVPKTAPYKLLGAYGKVSDFAAAAGASFGDLVATERRNVLANLMLNEENALINGDSSATAAPWGDGTSALSFDGILKLTDTANGTPSSQIQSNVGPFTLEHADAQIARLWAQGGRDLFVLLNMQEMMSWQKLLGERNELRRILAPEQTDTVAGYRVVKYVHPGSGEIVNLMVDRFMPAGTMQFGALHLPDGSPAMDVQVLPQAPVPPDIHRPEGTQQLIQGYVVTDLARSVAQPSLIPFLVSVFETFRLKSALHVAKSTGVTAAA